jgi:diguanylate cyclase (GGDEF)-like protein/PAS domain S-box-containing protein
MDVDIGTLEAVLSPYIVLLRDAGVEYVSDALADRLGVMADHLRESLSSQGELFSQAHEGRCTISLASAEEEHPVFSYTDIPLEDIRIIVLSEEKAITAPFMEETDPEIFIRMLKVSGNSCLIVEKGSIVYANEHFCSLVDYTMGQVLGSPVIKFVSRDSRADFIRACRGWSQHFGDGPPEQEIMFTARSGTRSHMVSIGEWLKRGKRDLLWIVMRDITNNRRLMRSLREEQKRFSELFGKSPMGILYISPRGTILECNDYVATLTGYTREEISGSPFTTFVPEAQAEVLKEDFRRLFTEDIEIKSKECVLRNMEGNDITIEYHAQLISRKGHAVKALMIFTDITYKKALEMELLEKNAAMERTLWDMAEVKDALEARAGELNKATDDLMQLNEKLNLLSITDGLTEIYNHRHFQDRLTEEVERLHRQKTGDLSLLMLDIDDFKKINDTYGHQCGDMVLKQLAGLLKSSVRIIDILARYGGEEFAVILPNTNTEQAVIVAERVWKSIRSTPFTLAERTTVKITVSIGVGTITGSGGEKTDLLRKADSALYAAKAKWKDRVEVWEQD